MNKKEIKDFLINKSIQEKLRIIQNIAEAEYEDNNDIEMLDCLSEDKNEEIRWTVAETLGQFNQDKTDNILIKLLSDGNELVRINVCDSLYNSCSENIIEILINRVLKDKSSLVRAYASLAIANIAIKINYREQELVLFFKDVLEKEKIQGTKIRYFTALYMLKEKQFLPILLNELENKLYRNRGAVANLIGDLIYEKLLPQDEIKLIKYHLNNRLQNETSKAVISAIEKALNNIDSNGGDYFGKEEVW